MGGGGALEEGLNEKIATTGFGVCNWVTHGAIYQFEEGGRRDWSRGEEQKSRALL